MTSLGGGLIGTLLPIAVIGGVVWYFNIACPYFGRQCNAAADFVHGATPLTKVEKTQQAGQDIITGVDTTSPAAKFLAPALSHHTNTSRLTIA